LESPHGFNLARRKKRKRLIVNAFWQVSLTPKASSNVYRSGVQLIVMLLQTLFTCTTNLSASHKHTAATTPTALTPELLFPRA